MDLFIPRTRVAKREVGHENVRIVIQMSTSCLTTFRFISFEFRRSLAKAAVDKWIKYLSIATSVLKVLGS